jgi:hypothetical protein
MTKLLKQFCELSTQFDKRQINAIWKNAIKGKTITIDINSKTTESLDGKCKNGTRQKHGVYRFSSIVGGKLICLYVGKGEATSLGRRWGSHFKAIRRLLCGKSVNESSAEKIIWFMQLNNLTNMDIFIDYVEFADEHKHVIHTIESKSIQYLNPILNNEHFVKP